jgi:hypothetical protein
MSAADPSKEETGPEVGPSPITPHLERLLSTSGEVILIECDCPIGQEHTYADWLLRFTRDEPWPMGKTGT